MTLNPSKLFKHTHTEERNAESKQTLPDMVMSPQIKPEPAKHSFNVH